MTLTSHQPLPAAHAPGGTPVQLLAQRRAAAGLGVEISRHRDTCELTVLGVAAGKSFVALDTGGQARWYYEPALQDRGLAVTLRVSEDLESFEATTDIDITSPTRPWLGTVTLSDDAALDWRCDLRAAFQGNPPP